MKNLLEICFLILFLIVFISCDSDKNIKGDWKILYMRSPDDESYNKITKQRYEDYPEVDYVFRLKTFGRFEYIFEGKTLGAGEYEYNEPERRFYFKEGKNDIDEYQILWVNDTITLTGLNDKRLRIRMAKKK
jgi:hypothetical protein